MPALKTRRKSAVGTPLTPAERKVLVRIAAGVSGREIATELDISLKTYDTHRGQILKKIGASGSNAAAGVLRYALERGLVPPVVQAFFPVKVTK